MLFYLGIGILYKKLIFSVLLEFVFLVYIIIENDECLGEMFVCIFKLG